MIESLLAFLALAAPLVSAQCAGYNYIPSNPYCGLNFSPSDNLYLESNLVPLDTLCPSAFGHTYKAQATYTDYEGVVSTVGLLKPVTSPANPAETVRFLYDVRYGDILEGSEVTVSYWFPRITLGMLVPGFRVYNTVEYTDTTSTTSTIVESGVITSTSTIHSTATQTITKSTTITSTRATETITLKPITKTRTITHAVKPTTRKVFTTKKITTTLSCIPNSKPRPRDLSNVEIERRDTIFESKTFAVPTCASTRPTTTTLYTNTVVKTSTITTKSTKTVYTTKIDRTVTTTYTRTIWINATGRVVVTLPLVTITKNVNALRVTVTTKVTVRLTVTKYATKTCCNKPLPPKYITNTSCVIKPPKTTKRVTTTKKVVKTTTKKVVKTTAKPKTTKKCTKSVVRTTTRRY
ncbi:uncharacterized protein DFL_003425 [Arthrobotrys flagrans]|uniref:Uncharacterized protein n=1 Tax=Arthrobotrys flagrans TaxID=97331 RepID=A0A437A1T3_ARTFL|nr:hypothetical protein DFL_003425 [Arthrobotrys flagrans]